MNEIYRVVYDEIHDGVDCAFVRIIAVDTGDAEFGEVYLMKSWARDEATDAILRDATEAIGVTSDAAAQRIGIGLFDSLVKELGTGAAA